MADVGYTNLYDDCDEMSCPYLGLALCSYGFDVWDIPNETCRECCIDWLDLLDSEKLMASNL